MKEAVFYAIVFIFSTLAISSVITALTARTYYTFDMYFNPGVYNFTIISDSVPPVKNDVT